MLAIEKIQVKYGNIIAVNDISLEIQEGQIVCLVGSNGAGKTTTMNAISGLVKISSGSIKLDGVDISNKPVHVIARTGLIPVPEGRKIFAKLTVYENLVMGAYTIKNQSEIKNNLAIVLKLFPELESRFKQFGGTLSGGEQQMLAIGRALMGSPRILLMDEPSMGLAPIVVNRIFEAISKIKREGVTIFLVEQNAKKALAIADYAYVVERGRITMSDSGKALLNNQEVVNAYLGGAVQ